MNIKTLEMKSCPLIERVVLLLHKLNLLAVSKRNLQKQKHIKVAWLTKTWFLIQHKTNPLCTKQHSCKTCKMKNCVNTADLICWFKKWHFNWYQLVKDLAFKILFKQTFKIGSARSSGSNTTDLEQILNEPLIFLEGKKVNLAFFQQSDTIKTTRLQYRIIQILTSTWVNDETRKQTCFFLLSQNGFKR